MLFINQLYLEHRDIRLERFCNVPAMGKNLGDVPDYPITGLTPGSLCLLGYSQDKT